MVRQHDWKKVLKADPTDWLLETDDPGVRYLALRDIVDADEKEVKAARRIAHREGPIATILAEMAPQGYWIKPGNVYANKCRGTVWSIISLAELGASIEEDKHVTSACDYLLDNALLKSGQISPRMKPSNMGLCLQGNMLLSLMDLGYDRSRLDNAYEYMARMVTGEDVPRKVNSDGLAPAEGVPGPFRYLKYNGPRFVCRTNKGMPCGWAGVKVMMAFSRLPIERRTGLIERAIETGADFFLSGDPSKVEFPGHRAGAPDKRWWQFRFPSFWGADILQIAEAFTGLGYGADPRLANTFDLILNKQDGDGRWSLEFVDYTHKMWVKYGTLNQPNKWVTLRALRVLKAALSSQ
ncbi:MAG: nitrogen fixation protein NifH [Dehalococcoidales bacterium]|nr:nitrogen fixation protein NifH [Dehalococcoidales bacterium]